MAVGPIPNIAAMPVKVASATPADLPSTRAVAFYPQQEESSYTPSGQGEGQQGPDHEETAQQEAGEEEFTQTQSFSSETIEIKTQVPSDFQDDLPAEGTISLFA